MQIPELFKSKRFWSALTGLVILMVSSSNSQLEAHLNVIAPAVVGIVGLLIGGYTVEQTVQAWKAADNTPKGD